MPWIKGHALSDMVEALEPLMDGVHAAALLATCSGSFSSHSDLRDFRKRLEKPPAARRPLGDKIDALRRSFPQLLPAELANAAKPLRLLRNCLTHASGVVRPEDCNDGSALRMEGLLWDAFFVSEAGEVEPVTPGFMSPGGHIGLRRRAVPLSWKAGERVSVTEGDLLSIAETLLHFAIALRKNLFRLLKDSGRLPESFELREPTSTVQVVFLGPDVQEVD